ncbi:phosphoribosyl anthranilate isomerase [Neokomagataea thailandica NBRC 106555]|uniref:N-(5'-phosphoribosyl)anthranilate isomerase n=2 Tax=Neokomagataea TaxID=1223423 RepID=A0A4Y6VAH5_9PROT|nr:MULTISPECIES: phosphoribosylanthranilate isomerase [Neokomagataea]QDH25571.1 phosphoribosylanthranilate isomerase [Neokomagataea tanensis]GBR52659.1 phosphoribosyl anthranilate isomerase [Neokomagataea thailandica NBRC 106555]
MIKIKICGVRDTETIRFCAEQSVEWLGFVFYPPSPRFLTLSEASSINSFYAGNSLLKPERVGLFVTPSDDDIQRVLDVMCLDILQVYAPDDRAKAIKEKFSLPVWQSRGISRTEDLPTRKICDGFVIEAAENPGDAMPGGLGRQFDWALTKKWEAPSPWMLAGGLSPENVEQAILSSGTLAVDVSSGVEEVKGVKSFQKIENFVKNVRKTIAKQNTVS